MTTPGWYPDPAGRFDQRYFDGRDWTSAVSRAGQQFVDQPNSGPANPQAPWQPQAARQSTIPFAEMSSDEPTGSRPTALIIGVVLGVVALAAGVLLVANSASDTSERSTNTFVDDGPASTGEVTEPTTAASEVSEFDPTDADGQPVSVLGAPLPPFSSSGADPAVGEIAPTISGVSFTGEPITIDGRQSGPVMVVFLAHWCPHCNAEIPRLLEWKASGAVPTNLQVIGVSTAVAASGENYPPATWLDTKGWSWPAMADQSNGEGVAGDAAQAMGASGWPYFVILGSNNEVLVRTTGGMEIEQLSEMVESALALDTGPVPLTKPVVSLPATLPTELQVTTLIAGSGPAVEVGDDITAHYVGVFTSTGEEFDNSYDRGQPFTTTVGVGMVIEGWDVGLLGLQAGGRYQLDIPADMAYGDDGAGGRPAGPLTFVVDIISVTPA